MMETTNNQNHIILGILSQKPMIFKVMDTLAEDKGNSEIVFGKTTSKLLLQDPLDYLKSQYKIRAESVQSSNTDNESKTVKKGFKRKLYPVKTKLLGGKSECVRYLSPLMDTQYCKAQYEDLLKWFSEKVIARKFLSAKRTLLQEFATESSTIYVSPIFYKSRASITFDRNKILFQLYLKEWFKMELSARHVNSVTVYSKLPIIKLSVRTKIIDEMSKLYSKYKLRGSDIFKSSPKKTSGLKDALLVFTNHQLSQDEFQQLVQIFGTDRLQWNESDVDAKELLENTLHKNHHLTEITSSKGRIKWSLIFKPKPKEPSSNKRPEEMSTDDNKPTENNGPKKTTVSIGNISQLPETVEKEITSKDVIAQNSLVVTIENTSMPETSVHKDRTVCKTKADLPHKDAVTESPRVVTVSSDMGIQHSKSKDGKASKRTQEITPEDVIAQNSLVVTISNNTQLPAYVTNSKPIKRKERTSSKSKKETSPKDSRVVTESIPVKLELLANKVRPEPQPTVSNGPPAASPSTNVSFMANGAKPSQTVINLPLIMKIEGPAVTVNNVQKPVQSTNLMYIPNRNLNNVFKTFHYNPSTDSDVLVHGVDLLCLNFGQYLNDNIINFYLNYIRFEIMSEDQRLRTHLFNVFFNTKLTQGCAGSATKDTPATRHARVAKWTKRTDIFDKDYIIIPINENQHWFLAIVCFPWMAGMISYDKLFGDTNNQSEIPVNQTFFATKQRVDRVKRLRERYGIEPSPCILLFDSAQSRSRAPNVKLIREYLKLEWDSKRRPTDGPLVFDKNTVRGFNPQVPQQTNNIDCGIFVLHYVEKFFQQPLKLFTKEYFQSSLLRWFDNETVARKRAAIQNMVLAKADEYLATRPRQNSCTLSSAATSNLDDSGPDIQIF